jgi:hypothetical protein
MRETGWPVRDRFILVSALNFHNAFQTDMVKWLAGELRLCGRQYVYLFDKGTGKPNLWLYLRQTTSLGSISLVMPC